MLTELINGRHNSQVLSSDKFTIPEGVEKTSVCKKNGEEQFSTEKVEKQVENTK